MPKLAYVALPVIAVLLGATIAARWRPSAQLRRSVQHLAAGVVFAAAGSEILPQVKHDASIWSMLTGGVLGVAAMLAVKSLDRRLRGPMGLVTAISIDFYVDGLVLGLGFLAGEKAGALLAIALTLEVLFLGLTLTVELGKTLIGRLRTVGATGVLVLFLPLGVITASPIGALPAPVVGGFLCFGLMALLYLVTEELLVDAHEAQDTPFISAMFFVGFLGLLLIEEMMG